MAIRENPNISFSIKLLGRISVLILLPKKLILEIQIPQITKRQQWKVWSVWDF